LLLGRITFNSFLAETAGIFLSSEAKAADYGIARLTDDSTNGPGKSFDNDDYTGCMILKMSI
jgi:hypothetical protein